MLAVMQGTKVDQAAIDLSLMRSVEPSAGLWTTCVRTSIPEQPMTGYQQIARIITSRF